MNPTVTPTTPQSTTRAQAGIVHAQRLDPDNPVFALAEVVEIPGRIDVECLTRALETVAAEADVLRREMDTATDVPVIDCTGSTDPRAAADRWIDADMATTMRPGHSPLVVFAILTIDDTTTLWYQRYHHSVLDGVGVTLVQDRVARVYRESAAGAVVAPADFGSIGDLIDDETQRCTGEAATEDGLYWRARLADHGGPVAIAPPTHRVAAGRVRLRSRLEADVVDSLRRAARDASVSWPAVPVAALAMVSAQVTGERDVVLALLTSNRSTSMRRTPGMVSNIVPLPLRINTADSLAVALGDVAVGLRTSAKRQRYRYEDLRRGESSSVTGAQVNLVLGESDLRFGTERAEVRNLAGGPFEDMALVIDCRNGAIEIVLDFDSAVYTHADAEVIERRYHAALTALVSMDASAPVAALNVLTEAERRRLTGFSAGHLSDPATETNRVTDHPLVRFGAACSANPQRTAVEFGSESCSYADIARRSDEVARSLQSAGVEPGTLVGVALPRSVDMIVGVLAAWKAGLGYVPIDPAHPADRIAHILRDANPQLVLTHSRTDSVVQDAADRSRTETRTLRIDDQDSRAIDPSSTLVDRPDDTATAYVIYTSGSTGIPKGVAVSHASLRNLVDWAVDTFGEPGLRRVYCATSLCFDVSVFEIFPALTVGGTVTVAENLLELAQHGFRGSLVSGVPSAMVEVLDGDAVVEVDTVVLAGEGLTDHTAERISRAVPGARIANIYGPTESTVYATAWFSAADGYRSTGKVPAVDPPIGRPLRGIRAHILDAALRPVPVGARGDLYLSGAGLAERYHRRPSLTAARFVALPASAGIESAAGERMYYTGDLAAWSESGDIRYLGRADNQVKIRGYRIETGEIAAVVRTHPEVSDAVVTARLDGPSGAPRLVAYVVAPFSDRLQARITAHCATALPNYMIPSAVVALDSFPKNVNGKLDLAALPAPTDVSVTTPSGTEPETDAEVAVCSALGDVLGRTVGLDDDFFALGGDSITAITAIGRIKRAGRAVTFRDFFDLRTPRRLAAGSTTASATVDDNRTGTLPVVPMMHWWADRAGTISTFNQSVRVRLPHDTQDADLRAALRVLRDTHDTLRLQVSDASGLGAEIGIDAEDRGPDDELLIAAHTDDECERARLLLSPTTGRLLVAVRTRPDELVLIVHHLAIDGVSWHVLLEDLHRAHDDIRAGRTPEVTPAPTSYRTWATDLTRTPYPDDELEQWRTILSTPGPAIAAELDPALDTVGGERVESVELPPALSRALSADTPTATHSTTGDLLLAALVHALGHEVVVDVERHGRGGGYDLSRTVGWFTTIHPVALHPLDSALETIGAVKTALQAIPNEGRGYGLLRYLDAEAGPILATAPTPQIGFNYLGRLVQEGPWSIDAVAPVPAAESDVSSAHPIEITAYATTEGALTLHVTSCPRLVSERWTADFLERWQRTCADLVRAAHDDPRRALAPSDFELCDLDTDELNVVTNAPIADRGLDDIAAPTPLQSGIVFHSIADDTDVYTAQFVFELGADVDDDSMQGAVDTVMAENPGLRTGFLWNGLRRPVSVVPTTLDTPITSVRLPGASAVDVEQITATERARPFRLDTPPLIRFLVLHRDVGHTTMAITCHHSILDGWSVPLLVKQLFDAYTVHATDPGPGRSTRPERRGPAATPREFLRWRARQDVGAATTTWATALDSAQPLSVADLARPTPTDETGTDSSVPSRRTDSVAFHLTPDEVEKVTAAATQAHVTVGTVAEVATALALGYACNRDDVLFGKTVSGRAIDLDGVDEIIGCLIETVPVRVRIEPDSTPMELLSRVHTEHLDRQSAYFLGLGEIARIGGVGHLFDVLMVFENYPNDLASTPSAFPIESMAAVDATHYPVTIVVDPRDGLHMRLDYRPALVDERFVRGLADRIRSALGMFAAGDSTICGDVDLSTPTERRQIRTAWNDTGHDVDVSSLTDLVRAGTHDAVAADPSWPAVISDETGYTYAEFDDAVRRTSVELDAMGVRGRIVAVTVPRSPDMVVVLHAVVAAGAAYLPIDPELPSDRRAYLVGDAEPAVVVGSGSCEVSGTFDYIDIDELLARAASRPALALPAPDPTSAAYVIYTSGSTGRPKGVSVSHHAIVNRLVWMQHEYGLDRRDRVLQKTPTSFDVSVWELFWPLTVGATMVVAEPKGHTDPYYLAGLIERAEITTVHFVPSMLTAYLAATDSARSVSLRRVFCSGEALPAESVGRFFDYFDSSTPPRLHNLYGPTEAAVDVTFWECSRDDVARGVVPIGRPVWNTRLAILDSRLRPVPPGAPGVLYLAGDQLADGYVHRPSLTASRFVADPFGPPGSRMYDTGDLCRWSHDGSVQYLGRIDNQIKLRGLRIELGEIENVLTGHPAVRAAAVVAHSVGSVTQLVAYIAPEDAVDIDRFDTRSVTDHAAAALPDYMVPPILVVLEDLPLGPNGKLDRRALPAPSAPESANDPAADEFEQLVIDLFARVLERTDVGATDNFFALGGDSITSIALVGRAASAGLHLAPADVFSGRSPRGIARLATPLDDHDIETGPAVGTVPRSPIVAAFDGIGALDGLHQSVRVRVPADTTAQTLTRALALVIDRHDAVRMRRRPDGEFEIAPRGTVEHAVTVQHNGDHDLDPLTDGRDLDPDQGRMMTARWNSERSELTLIAHHLVVDGLSWEPLLADLELAHAYVLDESTPNSVIDEFCASEGGTSYRHWAHMITRDTAARLPELDHWQATLAPQESPGSRTIESSTRPLGTVAAARLTTFDFPPSVSDALTSVMPEVFRCTAQDVLLTGLAAALQQSNSDTSVTVDLEGHGRSTARTDLSRTVGWFTTLYPVRLQVPVRPWEDLMSSGEDLGASVKAVKEQVRATPGDGTGFGQLRYLDPVGERLLSRYPSPAVCFNYLGRIGSDAPTSLWRPDAIGGGANPDARLRHAVEINCAVLGGRLRCDLVWDTTMIDERDIDELTELWRTVSTAMATLCTDVSNGGATPSDLSISGLTQADIDDIEDDLEFE